MELETQCPECKNNVFEESAGLDIDRMATCAVCGHSAKLGDLLTPDTINKVMKAAQQAAIKSLSNIKGFKKS